jgi:hypothetical protein
MRRHVDTTFLGGPKTGIDREKFDFPADFGSVREGLRTCSGRLKAVTGRSGRAQAELRPGGMYALPVLVIIAEYDPLCDARARRQEIGVGGFSGATMDRPALQRRRG